MNSARGRNFTHTEHVHALNVNKKMEERKGTERENVWQDSFYVLIALPCDGDIQRKGGAIKNFIY